MKDYVGTIEINQNDIIFDTVAGKFIKHFHDDEEKELVKKANIFSQPLLQKGSKLITENYVWFLITSDKQTITFFEDDHEDLKKMTSNFHFVTRGAKSVEEYLATLN